MLSPDEIACFRAFGFVVVKGCIERDQMLSLDRAFDRSMADAPTFDAYGQRGSRMRSHTEDADPDFAALIGHGPLANALQAALSVDGLYLGSFLLHNCDDTPWHTTGLPGEGVEGARFCTDRRSVPTVDRVSTRWPEGWKVSAFPTSGRRKADGGLASEIRELRDRSPTRASP